MLNEGDGRNYNDEVFTVLRKWITHPKPPYSSPRTSLRQVAELIGHHATAFLSNMRFLSNVKKIETNISEEGIRYRPIKEVPDKPVVVAKFHGHIPDRFYGGVGGFKASVSECARCPSLPVPPCPSLPSSLSSFL